MEALACHFSIAYRSFVTGKDLVMNGLNFQASKDQVIDSAFRFRIPP
jgi:hypothetical protein